MSILDAAASPPREAKTTGPTLYATLPDIGPVASGGTVYQLAHRATDGEPFMLSASVDSVGKVACLVALANERAKAAAAFKSDDKGDDATAARKSRKAIAADRTGRVVAGLKLYE